MPSLLNARVNYVEIYKRWLNASLPLNSGYRLIMNGYDATTMQYPDDDLIDEYDVVMLTGSPADAWSDEPWIVSLVNFVKKVGIEHVDVRIVGICFGHQIVSRSLGGQVARNGNGWETGPTVINNTTMGKLLYGVEKLELQQFHQDYVPLDSLAGSLVSGEIYLLGSSRRTPNQGLVKFYPLGPEAENPDFKLVEHVHILTSQGHPEFDEPIVTEITRQRAEKGIIPDETVRSYFGSKGEEFDTEPLIKEACGRRWGADYDGVLVVGKTFWKIFGVEYGQRGKHGGKKVKRCAHTLLRSAA